MRTRHIVPSGAPPRDRALPRGLIATFAALAALAAWACQPAAQTSPQPTGAEPEDHAAGEQPTSEAPEAPENDGAGEPSGERVLLVDEDHDQFAHVEGTSYDNQCETDADCHVGGCSSEVCSADPEVVTACVMPAEGWASAGGSCGCVEGSCRWYTTGDDDAGDESKVTPGRSPHALEGQGEACRDGECPEPLTCVTYYGVAGPQGPEFSSCEIPCPSGKDDVCPENQTCVVIADGPGQVCRPSSR